MSFFIQQNLTKWLIGDIVVAEFGCSSGYCENECVKFHFVGERRKVRGL